MLQIECLSVLNEVKLNVYVTDDMRKIADTMRLAVKRTLMLELALYFRELVPNTSNQDAKCIANMRPLNEINR